MRQAKRAYTLIELLIVAAILAVLSALLAPVFFSVKSSAQKTVCFSRLRETGLATESYISDYDDTFMPISYMPGQFASSKDDRTWVQMLLPYARNFSIFLCPSDSSRKTNAESTFDQDLVPGDLYSEYYRASMHTNSGYNYMALSPVIRDGKDWKPKPYSVSAVNYPSATVLYVDSVWSLGRNNQPVGGGNWLVEPPCRYDDESGIKRDLLAVGDKQFSDIFAASKGWSLASGNEFGGAWPWHFDRVNIVHVDGSVASFSINQLATGCNLQANWAGNVTPGY